MKQAILYTLILIGSLSLWAQTPDESTWLHQYEAEYFVRGSYDELTLETYLTYDRHGRVAVRIEQNWDNLDSLVYRYDEQGRVIQIDDYRGYERGNLFLYTSDVMAYDPLIPSLCTYKVGHQSVDGEWMIYTAQKIAITRDEQGQITRVADYTPAQGEVPDLPISYVKTYTYENGQLRTYTKELYNMDPITEEVTLVVDERWTDMEWDRFAGQVIDPADCLMGDNRLKSAHVYSQQEGEYDILVEYSTERPSDYVATQTYATGQLKEHSLCMTDAYGSAVEVFRSYRSEEGEPVLYLVECATDTYNEHHDLVQHEMAISATQEQPEELTVRKGEKYDYTYNPSFGNQWTSCTGSIYNQSYEDGVPGTYEVVNRIERKQWDTLATLSVPGVRINDNINDNVNENCYDLQGRLLLQPQRGLYIQDGHKTLR